MIATRLVTASLIAFIATTAAAQETARVAASPESKLWIEGTSNLHGWSCKTTEVEAAIDVERAAAGQLHASLPAALKRVEVKVPVKSLKCGHGAMDNNLYKALNADATPSVTYILGAFDVIAGEATDSFTLKTVGTLNVSGRENRVTMDIVATRMPDGTVKATGTVPIKMTDYGITPPTAIFGRLKTGNEVKVNFELTVGTKAVAAATTNP